MRNSLWDGREGVPLITSSKDRKKKDGKKRISDENHDNQI
jgi:hypothetical protein